MILASAWGAWHVPLVVLPARLVSLPVVVMFALAGCDEGGGSSDAGPEPPDVLDAAESCPDWTDELTSGPSGLLAHTEGGVVARIVDASDLPPRNGFNTWKLRLEKTGAADPADGGGAAIADDYQITWMCSFMPAHNHTAAPVIEDAAGTERDGEFVVDRLNLRMTGGWEIPVWVDPIDAGKPAFTGQRMNGEPSFCRVPTEPTRIEDMVFRVCVPKR